jgi:orotate phosphoribosyltransferase
VDQAEILEALEARGAVLRGHFRLSSGRHSDLFVQKFRALEDPSLTVSLGEELARLVPEGFEVVASPAVGAVVLGFSVGLAAGTRSIFSERVDDRMSFRRGFEIAPGERVLVVEDVVTTGGSAREVVELVRASGGEPVAVAVLIDRGDPARADLGAPLRSLVRLEVESHAPEDCPLCAAGRPLEDPGSRRL